MHVKAIGLVEGGKEERKERKVKERFESL